MTFFLGVRGAKRDAAFNHCRVNSGAGDISRRSQLCRTIGSIESRAHSQLSSNLVEQSRLTKEKAEESSSAEFGYLISEINKFPGNFIARTLRPNVITIKEV